MDKIKSEFPIFKNKPELVYLDSAATTQKPQMVIDAVSKFYQTQNANIHRGIYELSETATEMYENVRKQTADFVGASPAEIIFCAGATDGLNIVSNSYLLPKAVKGEKVKILTSYLEHHSNFLPWLRLKELFPDTEIELVSIKDGKLDLEDLEIKLNEFEPTILAVSHASNVLGYINPLDEIVKILNVASPNTKLLVDACQTAAKIKIDLAKTPIDFLVFSSHKLYGPTGVGILAIPIGLQERMDPLSLGGGTITEVTPSSYKLKDTPEKFEPGTPNIAGVIGFGKALEFVSNIGRDNIWKHEQKLTDYALEKLSNMESVEILGGNSRKNKLGVISFASDVAHPHDIAQILSEQNICVRAGHHCNQILVKQLTTFGSTTRASFGVYSTKEDIDKLVEAVNIAIKTFA